MRPGITITEETVGTGAQATKEKTVIVNARMLPLDEKDRSDVPQPWCKLKIDLTKRDFGPGLRYGVEDMRVGGRRVFVVSPSLTHHHAHERWELELLEVRSGPYLTPEEYPPGKHLQIIHPGELSRSLPKWNFGLRQDGNYLAFITVPIPGLKWSHARQRMLQGNLDRSLAVSLFSWLMEFPVKYADQIVSNVISYGGDSSWYSDFTHEVVCIHVGIRERGQDVCHFYLPETSEAWKRSEMNPTINGLFQPHCQIVGPQGPGKLP